MGEIIDVTPSSTSSNGSNNTSNNNSNHDVASSVTILHVMYGLHALAPFTMWLLAIIAMIIGALKGDDVAVKGTYLESHFSYLSSTFWWGILWAIIAWTLFWGLGIATLGIGMLFLWILPVAVLVWYLYRVIKGWLKLNDKKPAI